MTEQAPYGPLSARLYDLWFPRELSSDELYLLGLVQGKAGPALELGCGTGRLLLPLLAGGQPVDGVDASHAMLDVCREKLARHGLSARLVKQPLQALDLDQRYDVAFSSLGTFQLILSDADVMESLRRLRAHMAPAGVAYFCLFTPEPNRSSHKEASWHVRRHVELTGGGSATCFERLAWSDQKKVRVGRFRYEVRNAAGTVTEQEEETLGLRWYVSDEFAELLRAAGFPEVLMTELASDQPAAKEAESFLARAYT